MPAGLQAVANGELGGQRARATGGRPGRGARASRWRPTSTTATIGEFDLRSYRADGDPLLGRDRRRTCSSAAAPRTGERFAISQAAQPSYKRLARTIDVPAGGGQLSFWVDRDTEPGWDFVFVEARTRRLRRRGRRCPTSTATRSHDTGFACPYWLDLHPFLAHYQTDNGDGTCSPSGIVGHVVGRERRERRLRAVGGRPGAVRRRARSSCRSATPATTSAAARASFVDDIDGRGGDGHHVVRGRRRHDWTAGPSPGAPAGSEPNANDWIAGTAADAPAERRRGDPSGAFARQPEILAFLSGLYGRYPFSAAGGIVDDASGSASRWRTRPGRSTRWASSPIRPVADAADAAVVHELAHQWVGDGLALAAWQHIWLNEGFATYTEWLWSEHEGLATAAGASSTATPRSPPTTRSGPRRSATPGRTCLFDLPVYMRGAMTLHALRQTVGDARLLPHPARLGAVARRRQRHDRSSSSRSPSGSRVGSSTRSSTTWLFTPAKPPGIEPASR